jgi:hypothetical protein
MKTVFSIVLIQDGETISVHGSQTGDDCTASDLGLSILRELALPDGASKIAGFPQLPAAPWVQ